VNAAFNMPPMINAITIVDRAITAAYLIPNSFINTGKTAAQGI
jgi:hypothetical protein